MALSQIPGEQPVCVCGGRGETMKATGLTASVKKKISLLVKSATVGKNKTKLVTDLCPHQLNFTLCGLD